MKLKVEGDDELARYAGIYRIAGIKNGEYWFAKHSSDKIKRPAIFLMPDYESDVKDYHLGKKFYAWAFGTTIANADGTWTEPTEWQSMGEKTMFYGVPNPTKEPDKQATQGKLTTLQLGDVLTMREGPGGRKPVLKSENKDLSVTVQGITKNKDGMLKNVKITALTSYKESVCEAPPPFSTTLATTPLMVCGLTTTTTTTTKLSKHLNLCGFKCSANMQVRIKTGGLYESGRQFASLKEMATAIRKDGKPQYAAIEYIQASKKYRAYLLPPNQDNQKPFILKPHYEMWEGLGQAEAYDSCISPTYWPAPTYVPTGAELGKAKSEAAAIEACSQQYPLCKAFAKHKHSNDYLLSQGLNNFHRTLCLFTRGRFVGVLWEGGGRGIRNVVGGQPRNGVEIGGRFSRLGEAGGLGVGISKSLVVVIQHKVQVINNSGSLRNNMVRPLQKHRLRWPTFRADEAKTRPRLRRIFPRPHGRTMELEGARFPENHPVHTAPAGVPLVRSEASPRLQDKVSGTDGPAALTVVESLWVAVHGESGPGQKCHRESARRVANHGRNGRGRTRGTVGAGKIRSDYVGQSYEFFRGNIIKNWYD